MEEKKVMRPFIHQLVILIIVEHLLCARPVPGSFRE